MCRRKKKLAEDESSCRSCLWWERARVKEKGAKIVVWVHSCIRDGHTTRTSPNDPRKPRRMGRVLPLAPRYQGKIRSLQFSYFESIFCNMSSLPRLPQPRREYSLCCRRRCSLTTICSERYSRHSPIRNPGPSFSAPIPLHITNRLRSVKYLHLVISTYYPKSPLASSMQVSRKPRALQPPTQTNPFWSPLRTGTR